MNTETGGIHIVTHCYAGELPQYAAALQYQLSSLEINRPRVPVTVEICHTPEDVRTRDVVDWFVCNSHLLMILSTFPPGCLFRRAIGRNIAALRSHGELIWFADCDYVFGPGCLDGLWRSWESLEGYASMVFSREILVNSDYATGDLYLAPKPTGLLSIDPAEFAPKRYAKALGGVQIVPGSLARTHGYLDWHKRYQRPVERPFPDFCDDVAFKRFCQQQGPVVPVDVPQLYRIRHSAKTHK